MEIVKRLCLNILGVFSRRAFILKNYNAMSAPILQFLDENLWDERLDVQRMFAQALEHARAEQAHLNFEVFIIARVTDYLSQDEGLGLHSGASDGTHLRK